MSVTALSTRALSYQWFKDGVLIPDATQAVLAFGEVQLTDVGAYSVAINNDLGGITTPTVALNVIPAEASIALYPGVTIEGVVGKTFAVQYTTDVGESRTWTTLATITLTSPRQLWYDTEPAAQPKRFYRVIAAP